MKGLIGKKIGMTRVFNAQGQQTPVTAILCGPCTVLQVKTGDCDGYHAVQLGYGEISARKAAKPELGAAKKIGVAPLRYRREFKLDSGEQCKPGDAVTVNLFEGVSHVDVVGVSKGKGFAGVMRRHGMSGGPITHGGHSKRRVGSIGCRELPGRIQKGKRMPGHLGMRRVSQQNLRVVMLRAEENILLVEGSVPGHAGSILMVKKSLKLCGSK